MIRPCALLKAYYGDTPLCFAESLSDPETLHTLCLEAQKAIKEGIKAGWRPDASKIIAPAKTQRENFEKRTLDRGHHDWFHCHIGCTPDASQQQHGSQEQLSVDDDGAAARFDESKHAGPNI